MRVAGIDSLRGCSGGGCGTKELRGGAARGFAASLDDGRGVEPPAGFLDGEALEGVDRGVACVGADALLTEFGLLGEGVEESLRVRMTEPGDEPLRREVVHGGEVDEGVAAGEVVVDQVGDVDVRGENVGRIGRRDGGDCVVRRRDARATGVVIVRLAVDVERCGDHAQW